MKNLISCFIFFLVFPAFGQFTKSKAHKEFQRYNYALAIQYYQKYLEHHVADYQTAYELAESYRKINKPKLAAGWYKMCSQFPNCNPEVYLWYGHMLKQSGEYLEAIDQFVAYGEKEPEKKPLVSLLTHSAYQALDQQTYPKQTIVENAEKLNSVFSEFSPVLYKNNLIFTSDRPLTEQLNQELKAGWTGNPFLKLLQYDSSGQIHLFSEMTRTGFHDGPAAFTPSGDTVFFTATKKIRKPGKDLKSQSQNIFLNRLELWYTVRKGGQWQQPESVPFNNSPEYSIGHPAVSPDGKKLYFVSDMQGGIGESDLYYCDLNTGKWEKPVLMEAKINSPYKELFPTIPGDGYLYFSSDRPEGMGGLDIYKVKLDEIVQKKAPEPLGYPINSCADDFGLIYDSTFQSGYFSSSRPSGKGLDDIYSFREPGCVLSGITLKNNTSGNPEVVENVLVELFKKGDTTETIGFVRSSGKEKKKICVRAYEPCRYIFNAKGKFFFDIQQNQAYELKASKEHYFTQTINVPQDCKTSGDTIYIALLLTPIEINKPILITNLFFDDQDKLYVKKNIYFDLDKANIREDASLTLDKLVALLKNNPELVIELGAHTDSRHTKTYNLALSQQRAEAAVQYIVSKGIEKEKITAKGYGETQLLNHCADDILCTEEEHQLNRRVEIKILEVKHPGIYVVKPNDTLYSIAKKFNITIEHIRKINNLSGNMIFVGDKIKLK